MLLSPCEEFDSDELLKEELREISEIELLE